MTDVNVALQAVVDSIASKAATAAPSDLAYLGKALEAVAPGSQTSLIVQIGGAQVEAVETAGAAQVAAVNTAGTAKTNQVNTAGDAKIAAVNAAGDSKVSEINAATLGGAATLIAFSTSSLNVALPNNVRPKVYVKADPVLALSNVTLRMPVPANIPSIMAAVDVENASWAVVEVKDSTGAVTFGRIGPMSSRVMRVSGATGGWSADPVTMPSVEPSFRVSMGNQSTNWFLALSGYWSNYSSPTNNQYASVISQNFYASQSSDWPWAASVICNAAGSPHSIAALRLFNMNGTIGPSLLGWIRKKFASIDNTRFDTFTTASNGYQSGSTTSSSGSFSASYIANSHGWRTLAVAAVFVNGNQGFSGSGCVNLHIADISSGALVCSALRVLDTNSVTDEMALIPFLDDRTFLLIIPTSAGRFVYRYQVGVNGIASAKGMMSFSVAASFVKISHKRLLVIDGGASGIYSMDDSGNTMTLKYALPLAVYSLCGVAGVVGAYLDDGVAVLGNGSFALAPDDTVSGRANSYAGFGAGNKLHLRKGVFIEQSQSMGNANVNFGQGVLSYISDDGTAEVKSSPSGNSSVSYQHRLFLAAYRNGVASLFHSSASASMGAGYTTWDMNSNCLMGVQ